MSVSCNLTAMLFLFAALGAGCAGKEPTGPEANYDPVIPSSWAVGVTNPYFRLVPGTTWTYRGESAEGVETVVVEVLAGTRRVNGVDAVIVRDRVSLDGELIEDTTDWYAQDASGNVWYLGEDSKEIENGVVVSTEGSWEWGADGALPGIIMWGDPTAHVGESYRQEYYAEEAEDWGKVVAVAQSVTVPEGTYTGCVKTEDWSGLESGTSEFKYYAPGIGFVLEIHVGSGARLELTRVTGPGAPDVVTSRQPRRH